MIVVQFWMGGERVVWHSVSEESISACYALPKTADRFAYWRGVTGDQSIASHVLVWTPVR